MTSKKWIPTWHTEALDRHIDYIVLVYEKAEGFVFCPSNLEHPFRIEGDYMGSVATNAMSALGYLNSKLNTGIYTDRVSWIIEFVEKILQNEDFSLDDLNLGNRAVRIIKGAWPW